VFSDCSEDFSFYVVDELFFVELGLVCEGPDGFHVIVLFRTFQIVFRR